MKPTGNILITGGSGTLGRAIIDRAQREGWTARFTVYSRSELLQAQMRADYPNVRYVLGDVRDYDRLAAVMAGHETVIHAAAMKRIPECEAHPSECYATNVGGSLNVLRAASAVGVRRVLGISTDKACRATTAYGASKLAMEKAFLAAPFGGPIVTCVRYGNVVASRGSVIPLWREQAEKGKPITITHPEMTRFWMSVDEAVDLVLRGLHAEHGEVWVRKMGALPIMLMLEYAGLGDQPISITGLRSDEKLHEDLIHEDEPVVDQGGHYVITPGGQRGTVYRSNTARWLTIPEFRTMLGEPAEVTV